MRWLRRRNLALPRSLSSSLRQYRRAGGFLNPRAVEKNLMIKLNAGELRVDSFDVAPEPVVRPGVALGAQALQQAQAVAPGDDCSLCCPITTWEAPCPTDFLC